MKMWRLALMCLVAGSLLTGCGSLKKLTGQRDDSVLPGEREDILPADQQVNPKIDKKTSAADATACDPTIDVSCPPAVDQEVADAGTQ
jgi:hypothetical protein